MNVISIMLHVDNSDIHGINNSWHRVTKSFLWVSLDQQTLCIPRWFVVIISNLYLRSVFRSQQWHSHSYFGTWGAAVSRVFARCGLSATHHTSLLCIVLFHFPGDHNENVINTLIHHCILMQRCITRPRWLWKNREADMMFTVIDHSASCCSW